MGELIQLEHLHRYLRDQEMRAIRERDERRIMAVDAEAVDALRERMRTGTAPKRKLLDVVRLAWAKEA